jgi:UDP-N-acetylglucosamine 1-carboxyvinyltransferase
MDKFVVDGGRPLEGRVDISGSKNASLPLMVATLCCPQKHVLRNVPALADVHTMKALLTHLGADVSLENGNATIDVSHLTGFEAPYDIVRKMRASFWVLAPLLHRFGRARVSLPGGCAIGARPIDMHLRGLEAMGAYIQLEHGYVEATCPASGLHGAKILLDFPSVGATHQLVMAAVLAKGTTLIENAAREPEIVELAQALSGMGARISGAGSSTIEIEGVSSLSAMDYTVGPDRIETGTFIALAAATGGDIVIRGVNMADLDAVVAAFTQAGCQFYEAVADGLQTLRVVGPKRLSAVDIRTAPFPGFPTDMQAQFLACMTLAKGTSHLEENIFENRFMHVLELGRMGADITLHGHYAVIKGVEALSGAPVMATDLRASASLLIAALCASGRSEILRIYHLDRGYDRLDDKVRALGGQVRREPQPLS